jgi:hypothetical protein
VTLAGVPVLGLKSGALPHAALTHRWLGAEGWQVLLGALEAGRKTVLSLDLSHTTDAAPPDPRLGVSSSSSSASASGSGAASAAPGLGLVPLLGRRSCALARLALDGGAVPGDAFALALAPTLPRNRALTDLSLVPPCTGTPPQTGTHVRSPCAIARKGFGHTPGDLRARITHTRYFSYVLSFLRLSFRWAAG